MPPPLCIGHRGAAGHVPENTIASVLHALDAGADGIEIDVHCCKDEVVVIHDPTLDRTTNGSGPVSSRAYAELRTLDAGDSETIPTLTDVLDALPVGVFINVELKGAGTAQAVIECLRQRDELSQRPVLISSFDWDMLATTRKIAAEFDIAPLTRNDFRAAIEAAEQLDAVSLNMSFSHVTARLTEDAHLRGKTIGAYTVNETDDIERMLNSDIDFLISDYPDRVRAAMNGG